MQADHYNHADNAKVAEQGNEMKRVISAALSRFKAYKEGV